MSGHIDVEISGVSSLTGSRVDALDTGDERGYLLQLGKPDGSRITFLSTVTELESLRQQIERATLSGMFG